MLWLATLVFACSLSPNTGLSQTQPAKKPPKAVRVTGCLVKGDESGEVWLAQKDGTIYGLEGSKIELNANLGHKVIVTGYVQPEDREEANEETKKQHKGGKIENADFRVLRLESIGAKCRQ